ncbi:restriction endonuclease subunit S [Aeromonas salmonicida]|uniref:restriction endonuclease subunit S n=1 Tax=Aeromonas salmonicida TaxID=645 RepID=UPI003D19E823
MAIENLITDHLDLWTAAVRPKSSAGRGSNSKLELTGIKKLRELILELAVRGKLVPQDPSDEPASVLLERIATKQGELIKTRKIKKPHKLPEISEDEKTVELPESWSYVRFGYVLDFSGGSQPPKSNFSDVPLEGYVQLIQIRDLGPSPQPIYVPESMVSKFCTPDDVMIGRYGASVGKVFWGKEGAYNVALIKLHNDFGVYVKEFLYLLMLSPIGQALFSGISRSAQAGFSKSDIECGLLPLLSHSEQHRIVAKVDELMALCDQLELRSESQLAAHQMLVETLLATLIDTADADELAHNWARLSTHFDILFTTEASIDALKQTILQLAVMGKLVPQDPSDEPASTLLARITAEKTQLIKEKKIKTEKPLPAIGENEKPFELPQGWGWCRLGRIINLVSGQHLKPNEYSENSLKNGVPYITGPAEFGAKHPIYSKYTTEFRALAKKGDILITCKGAGLGKLNLANETIAISRQLMAIQLLKGNLEFLFILVNSQYKYFQDKGVGIAIPGISRGDVEELVLMLPPLEEQNRIVAKVDELMTLCDQLKSRLQTSQQTQLALAESLVEGALT